MQAHRSAVSSVRVALSVAILVLGAGRSRAQAPIEPARDSGQSVIGAYEGWYEDADGSFTLLMGYFNRNMKEALDIPVGPDNQIEPGGPDQGQPTHFLPRRQWGAFTIAVSSDFGDKTLTWTLVAHGHSTVVPMSLSPLWRIEPFEDAAMGNTPPAVSFEQGGATFEGPPRGIAASFSTNGSDPVTLTLWVTDDMYRRPERRRTTTPPLAAYWSKFRGPGGVTFDNPEPEVPETGGKVATMATFDTPGDYMLRAEVTDTSGRGGGGAQCCWTTVHVKVTVNPGSSSR